METLNQDFPDDFFVGIGDINSTFLPKLDASAPTLIATPAKTPPSMAPAPLAGEVKSETNGAASADSRENVLASRNVAALEAQLEERPLAKKEKELQEHEEEEARKKTPTPPTTTSSEPEHLHHRKALLRNDDTELIRVGKVCTLACPLQIARVLTSRQILDEVHSRFFAMHESSKTGNNKHRTSFSAPKADVTVSVELILGWFGELTDTAHYTPSAGRSLGRLPYPIFWPNTP